MADSIKIGNIDISAFKVGSADTKVYLGDTLLYPTAPPSFNGKWLATYTGGTTSSAECDASSAITYGEINLSNLVSLEIGDCVTSIGEDAFAGCGSLTSIDIPDSVTSIGYGAFRSCDSLTSCTIGSGVTSIGQQAFQSCYSLESVIVNATMPPMLGGLVFFGTPIEIGDGYIYVPDESVMDYKSASGWSDCASRIQAIPNS